MAVWTQSLLLQALGWAMLNSFWQMAVLYIGFRVLGYFFQLSSHTNYQLSVSFLALGAVWFGYTFLNFYRTGIFKTIVSVHSLAPTLPTLNVILSSASVIYLILLIPPFLRLLASWKYTERLKKSGLQKAAIDYRLFVKKIAQQLHIKQSVKIYLSDLVQSPVTIGYIKPIILLPIAALSNLSTEQVETVLLHELAHIKRHDFLVNLFIVLLRTIFYFNPFVRKFASQVEYERERCCDALVLQFQYDKISYVTALLILEKHLIATQVLALAAAAKNHLSRRIETILGSNKKAAFSIGQVARSSHAILLTLLLNGLILIDRDITTAAHAGPGIQANVTIAAQTFSKAHTLPPQGVITVFKMPVVAQKPIKVRKQTEALAQNSTNCLNGDFFMPVGYTIEKNITTEEKTHIEQTIKATKEVLAKPKWEEAEKAIGDGMTAREKRLAKSEYLNEINKVDWKSIKKTLALEYSRLNWETIDSKLNTALFKFKLDSLQITYDYIIAKIRQSESQPSANKAPMPLPDASVEQLNALKTILKVKSDSIQSMVIKRVINF